MAKVRLLDPERREAAARPLRAHRRAMASGGMATVFLGRLWRRGRLPALRRHQAAAPQPSPARKRVHRDVPRTRLQQAPGRRGIHRTRTWCPSSRCMGESDSGYYLVMRKASRADTARAAHGARARPGPAASRGRCSSASCSTRSPWAARRARAARRERATPSSSGPPRRVAVQNVLVGVDGCSRITDFGVAHAASRLQNTRADRLKGKLAYMSPEQARTGQVDRRADVFAMGIILWEVLAAKRLFKGENEAVTLHRVTSRTSPSRACPSVARGAAPGARSGVRPRRWSATAANRYFSAADMAEALLERAARAAANASATDLGARLRRARWRPTCKALGEGFISPPSARASAPGWPTASRACRASAA